MYTSRNEKDFFAEIRCLSFLSRHWRFCAWFSRGLVWMDGWMGQWLLSFDKMPTYASAFPDVT